MSQTVRALQLPGRHVLDSLAQRLSQALQPWCARWCGALVAELAVQSQVAERFAADEHVVEIVGTSGRLWLRRSVADLQALARAVFGEGVQPADHAGDTWAQEVLAQARAQLDDHLAQGLVGEVQATLPRHPPAELFAFGAGGTWLACPQLGIVLLADAGVLQHVPPRSRDEASSRLSPLVPLLSAARQASVPLSVGLGSIELELAHLLELQPGDVLCLQARLTDRLPVTLAGQPFDVRPMAQGSLGHLDHHKAVQLVSA